MPDVLLIEADPRSAKLARVLLEAADWRVTCVPTAEEAHEVLAHARPHLVVTELPVSDTFRHITNLRLAVLDTPIVAVTSLFGSSVEFRALTAGCSGFIRKPIDITTFASQLRAFLGDR